MLFKAILKDRYCKEVVLVANWNLVQFLSMQAFNFCQLSAFGCFSVNAIEKFYTYAKTLI